MDLIKYKENHKTSVNSIGIYGPQTTPPTSFSTALFFTDVNGYRQVADGVTALFDDNYSAAVDEHDAYEINNWDENIAINRGGKHLSIESRPQIALRDTIPLFMNNMRQMEYQFEFTGNNFSNPALPAALVDNFTGLRTPINVSGTTIVPFAVTSVTGSAANDRFMIVFGPGPVPLPTANPGITVYPNPVNGSVIYLQLSGMEKGTYTLQLSNTIGQVVFRQQFLNTGGNFTQAMNLGHQFPKGSYELTIIFPDNKLTVQQLVVGQ